MKRPRPASTTQEFKPRELQETLYQTDQPTDQPTLNQENLFLGKPSLLSQGTIETYCPFALCDSFFQRQQSQTLFPLFTHQVLCKAALGLDLSLDKSKNIHVTRSSLSSHF